MDDSTLQIVLTAVDNASRVLGEAAQSLQDLATQNEETMSQMAEATTGADEGFVGMQETLQMLAGVGVGSLSQLTTQIDEMIGPIDETAQALNTVGESAKTAEGKVASFGEGLKNIVLLQWGQQMVDQFKEATKAAIDFTVETASGFETAKAQFDVLLGSAQAGSAMMAQIAQYEPQTSFDFSQLTNATQQLLALGVASKDVIPDLKTLSDVSLGNADHLDHLAYTFGQVKDQTKLSAMQVREFVQGANVDILQLLTNYLNAHGKAYEGVATSAGGAAVAVGKHGKAVKDTTLAITTLNQHIAETQLQNKILGESHNKAAVAADKHALAVMKTSDKLADYNTKLSDATKSTQTSSGAFVAAGKLNAEQVKKMISDGDISFADVQGALQQSTEKGGMYFQAMQKHMETFSGIMSSIRTQFQQTALEAAGFNMNPNDPNTFGDTTANSPWSRIKDDLQLFLDFLRQHKAEIGEFFQTIFTQAANLADAIAKNKNALLAIGAAIAGAFTGVAVAAIIAFITMFGGAIAIVAAFSAAFVAIALVIKGVTDRFNELKPALITIGVLLAALMLTNPFTAIILGVAALTVGIVGLATQTDIFKSKQDLLKDSTDRVRQAQKDYSQALKDAKDDQKALGDLQFRLSGQQLQMEHDQKNLNDAVRIYGANSLEARDARHQLDGTERDIKDTMQQVNEKMATSKDDLQKVHDKTIDLTKAQQDHLKVLKEHETAWGNISNGIENAFNWYDKYAQKISKATGGISTLIPFLPSHAAGTSFAPGGLSLVGEHGPELVNLPRGSQVIPNNQINNSRQQSVTIQNVNINNEMDIDTLARRLTMGFKFNSAIL